MYITGTSCRLALARGDGCIGLGAVIVDLESELAAAAQTQKVDIYITSTIICETLGSRKGAGHAD